MSDTASGFRVGVNALGACKVQRAGSIAAARLTLASGDAAKTRDALLVTETLAEIDFGKTAAAFLVDASQPRTCLSVDTRATVWLVAKHLAGRRIGDRCRAGGQGLACTLDDGLR
jgi:hypothetical protein